MDKLITARDWARSMAEKRRRYRDDAVEEARYADAAHLEALREAYSDCADYLDALINRKQEP